MNKLFANTAAAAMLSAVGLVVAQADVGPAAEPGSYGRVDTVAYPQPALVSQSPVTIVANDNGAEPQYLWVPLEQRQNWSHYCAQYAACGAPVLFVQDNWYNGNVLRSN